MVKNMVIIMIHSERFPLETVSHLYAPHICPSKVLRRITSITDELNIPYDLSISSIFSGADLTLSSTCAFTDLPSTATDLSWRPIPPSLSWFRLDVRPSVCRPPLWPD